MHHYVIFSFPVGTTTHTPVRAVGPWKSREEATAWVEANTLHQHMIVTTDRSYNPFFVDVCSPKETDEGWLTGK